MAKARFFFGEIEGDETTIAAALSAFRDAIMQPRLEALPGIAVALPEPAPTPPVAPVQSVQQPVVEPTSRPARRPCRPRLVQKMAEPEPPATNVDGRKAWSPERRAKFMATISAKGLSPRERHVTKPRGNLNAEPINPMRLSAAPDGPLPADLRDDE